MTELKKEINELYKKKKEIEEIMIEISDGLFKENALEGSLIDEKGFPRKDIDVHNVLIQRKTLNCNVKIKKRFKNRL
jgi:hypothetical protein